MKKRLSLFLGWMFVLVLAACSLPQAAVETALPNATSVYSTISARLTATGSSPVQTVTGTPQPMIASPLPPGPVFTVTASPTPVLLLSPVLPTATAVPIPCELAAPGRPYVDLTIPDGTRLKAGQAFSKIWRLVNAGSCPWTKDYAIVWFSGEAFGAVREQLMGTTVRPGQSIDITVDMVAPRGAGIHQSNWKLRNPRNGLFGIGPNGDAPFWVRIEVEEAATATATSQPSPTPIPTLTTLIKGVQEMGESNTFDLDTGQLSTGVGDDLAIQRVAAGGFMLVPINNTRLAEMGMQTPGDLDCRGATLTTASVPALNLKEGGAWCYRTSQGLPGYLRIKTVVLKDLKLTFDFMTWAIP